MSWLGLNAGIILLFFIIIHWSVGLRNRQTHSNQTWQIHLKTQLILRQEKLQLTSEYQSFTVSGCFRKWLSRFFILIIKLYMCGQKSLARNYHNYSRFTTLPAKRKPVTSLRTPAILSWPVLKFKYAYLQSGESLEFCETANSSEIIRKPNLMSLVLWHFCRVVLRRRRAKLFSHMT